MVLVGRVAKEWQVFIHENGSYGSLLVCAELRLQSGDGANSPHTIESFHREDTNGVPF